MDRLEEGGKRVIPRADITVNALLGGTIHACSEDRRMGRHNLEREIIGCREIVARSGVGASFDLVILSYTY